MHQVYIDIVIDTILEQYNTQQDFFEGQLGISAETWNNWQQGEAQLSPENTQKIKNLFSDYEWLLVQKVLRQTILFPEKRTVAVAEYRELKTKVVEKWVASGIATVELQSKAKANLKEAVMLKVVINYGTWGYDDVITFCLPATIQNQIETSHVTLLNWVNENLAETYPLANTKH